MMADGLGSKSLSTMTMEINFHSAYGYSADGSGAKSLCTVTMEINFHSAYGYTAVDYG